MWFFSVLDVFICFFGCTLAISNVVALVHIYIYNPTEFFKKLSIKPVILIRVQPDLKPNTEKNPWVRLVLGLRACNSNWSQLEPDFLFYWLSLGRPPTRPKPSELHPYPFIRESFKATCANLLKTSERKPRRSLSQD